jgi:protein SCO1
VNRRLRAAWLAGAGLLAALLAAGCGGQHASEPTTTRQAAATSLRGLVPEPVPRRPSFTLTDTSGRPFSFAARTRGRLTYLYFGYTHCPDACPTTMSDLAAALRRQPEQIRRRVDVVFVTVDPRRDTRAVLRRWLDHFDRSFIGLTGSLAAITAAERVTGVPLAPPEKHTGTSYAVSHATLLLPYSPDGRAHVVYAQGFHTRDYAHDMPLLLRY